jgi:NitT/TauT family transport system substrate-binding protein
VKVINDNPAEARKYLVKNTFTPDDVAATVPLVRFEMVSDLKPSDIADFQRFMDFSTKTGILPEKVDVSKFLARF